ncbi:MAG: FG-GAP-like repeat-containing protein [Planctomycetes bacterium]|nr:FG-GAP-like repeat-containing protein [Planctomycetota bacterium]
MRSLGRARSVLGPLLLSGSAAGQGYPALQLDGVAGVTLVGGNSIAAAGDVDGDGVTDVIVGKPDAFDQIGRARIYSGATGILLRTFTGSVANDLFGWAVTGAGDLNGDGLADVIVSALTSSAGGVTGAGRATAFSGANGAVLWTRDGTLPSDGLGYSLARVGDVDGDGIDDSVVGVWLGDVGGAFDVGRAEVLSGATGAMILEVTGATVSENLGIAVGGAGDVSGDGIPDFLAGAPEAPLAGQTNVGRAFLYSGADGTVLLLLNGSTAGDYFGSSLAGPGDLDGDAVPDVLVGAPQNGVAGGANGYVRAYSGATGGTLFTASGVGVFEKFGASIAGVSDLNGDVVPDLVVGAPGALGSIVSAGAGRVSALSGASGAVLFNVQGATVAGTLGTSVCGLPDVSGDGIPDFAAGEPGPFSSGGRARVHSGAGGAALFTFQGQASGDGFGRAAAFVGDVDGDGREDLLVGAPNASPGLVSGAGRATLHSGASGATLGSAVGPWPNALFGAAVAGVGDVDGDGTPDLAIGSPGDPQTNGRVWVLSGATGGALLDIPGGLFGASFGSSVAGTGDLDGDGVPDVVAGAPGPIPLSAGSARAHSGASGAVLATYSGTGAGTHLGASVAGVGDADGDGVPDVAVGAPEPGAIPFAQPGEGFVRVFSGATGALLRQFDGTLQGSGVGLSVAGAGDVDGDGLADVITGAPGLSLPGAGAIGAAAVFSVPTGSLLFLVFGASAGDGLGASVSGGRDLDGDGVPDFLTGAAGGVSSLGLGRVFSGATGAPLLSISGSVPGEGIQSVVSLGGDSTGDGVPDLLLGSPFADPAGRVDAGRARLFSAVGLPAGSTPYGSGCAGTGGFVPTISTFGGAPAPGNAAFGISIARGRGGAPAILFFGSLPDPIGVPVLGCPAHVSGAVFALPVPIVLGGTAAAPGEGYRLLGIPVPPDPTLSGAQVHLQWAVADPGSANGVFAASAALTIVIP